MGEYIHANAFYILGTQEAEEIAASRGINKPQQREVNNSEKEKQENK
jgi:hypothetical protein